MKSHELAMMTTVPTPYPEVNEILNVLLPEVQTILGNQFVGLYLYGSLAYGGFDQDSDVDFVAVTAGELPEPTFLALREMHAHIATMDSWVAIQLEGSYIPQQALQTFDPVRVLHLHIDRGPGELLQRMQIDDPGLSQAWWGGWVFLRAVLHANGIALAGPNPKTFIAPVSPDELKQAALATLHGWLKPLLKDPHEIENRGFQSYIVLTLCRTLYTLHYGEIDSKQVAARWAEANLGNPWISLIERAWVGRHDPATKVSAEDLKETQDFVRYALEHTP